MCDSVLSLFFPSSLANHLCTLNLTRDAISLKVWISMVTMSLEWIRLFVFYHIWSKPSDVMTQQGVRVEHKIGGIVILSCPLQRRCILFQYLYDSDKLASMNASTGQVKYTNKYQQRHQDFAVFNT